jgi:hypothetical protein
MGEGAEFDEIEMERWDRDLGRPTNADIALRHQQIRQEAEMVRKFQTAITKRLIWEKWHTRDLLHGKAGHGRWCPRPSSGVCAPATTTGR